MKICDVFFGINVIFSITGKTIPKHSSLEINSLKKNVFYCIYVDVGAYLSLIHLQCEIAEKFYDFYREVQLGKDFPRVVMKLLPNDSLVPQKTDGRLLVDDGQRLKMFLSSDFSISFEHWACRSIVRFFILLISLFCSFVEKRPFVGQRE